MGKFGWHSGKLTAAQVVVGSSAGPLSLGTGSAPISSLYTTSPSTSGNMVTSTLSQTMTVASSTNTIEAAQFVVTSAVQMGNWANAVLAKVDLSTTGYVTGLIGVVCAELDMPSTAVPGGHGTYSIFEAEINVPAASGVPIHVFQINAWGDGVTDFDDNGYLFEITGVSSGATSFWYDHQGTAPTNTEEWIRVKTPSGVRYLALYNAVV